MQCANVSGARMTNASVNGKCGKISSVGENIMVFPRLVLMHVLTKMTALNTSSRSTNYLMFSNDPVYCDVRATGMEFDMPVEALTNGASYCVHIVVLPLIIHQVKEIILRSS